MQCVFCNIKPLAIKKEGVSASLNNYFLDCFLKYASRVSGFCAMTVLIFFAAIHSNAQSGSEDSLLIALNTVSYRISTESQDNIPEAKNISAFQLTELLERDKLSGDWWGARNSINNAGLDFYISYKGEYFANINGGNESGSATLDNIDLVLSADLDKIMNISSASLTVQILGNSGGSPCDLVGAVQGISNIETVPTWKLYQLLLEKNFFDDRLSVMAGLYDLNSEFDTRESSSIFINPSHGIGAEIAQSGVNGPSIFPTTSVALRLKYISEKGDYLQAAVFDGIPGDPENPYGTSVQFNRNDGLFLVAELGTTDVSDGITNNKISFGAWSYTNKYNGNNTRDYGIYLSAEKMFISRANTIPVNLAGFFRIGYANTEVNPVDLYIGSGITCSGLMPGSREDAIGIALAYARNSSIFRNAIYESEGTLPRYFELNLELTYLLHLTPWLSIQPDIQYVINPNYCTVSDNSFVLGSRIQIVF